MNQTIDLIMKRKSIRSYRSDPIPKQDRSSILEAMRRAPTAGNQTLYSVIQVEDGDKKRQLADSCDHQPFIAEAPWVLVFLADLQRMYDFLNASGIERLVTGGIAPPVRPQEGDALLACCDALIAAHTAVTAAESLGIGSCYVGDILENYEKVQAILSLPQYAIPITLVTFGFPTDQQKDRPATGRMPLNQFVFTDSYRRLAEEELVSLYDYNLDRSPRFLPGAENIGQHIYLRKFSSEFMREMRRSVRQMLAAWR